MQRDSTQTRIATEIGIFARVVDEFLLQRLIQNSLRGYLIRPTHGATLRGPPTYRTIEFWRLLVRPLDPSST